MPTIDPATPGGIQPVGFSSGFTLTMSDEFASGSLDSKWQAFRDFGDFTVPSGNWDLNVGSNSLLRMWWNGNTATDNVSFRTLGANPFRQRFGFFECRVKQLRGRGFFPAFWVFDDATQNELDFYECFSYDNGDTWTDGPPNWRPTDAALTQWNQGGSVQVHPADDLAVRRLRYPPPRGDSLPQMFLNEAFHTFGCYWSSTVIRFYYDGEQIGTDMAPTPELASLTGPQMYVLVELWWGPNGGNPTPNSSETPQGSSNALEFDYVRVWSIGGGGGPAFNASVVTAPADGATISGNVPFSISGNLIQNAELLPPTGYSPKYGTFSITGDQTSGTFTWDTTALPNGPITVRIAAYDVPAGGSGNEVTAMAARTYTINNAADVVMPICTSMDMV